MPANKQTSPQTLAKAGYHHGDLEPALIAAVRELVERDGVEGFSIADACKQLGVSTAAPYKHFANKHDILAGVARAGFGGLAQGMERARDAEPDDAVRRIGDMGKAYVSFAIANPGTFKLMFGATPNVKDNDTVRGTGFRCFGVLISEVERYLGPAGDAAEAQNLAVMLWTFVHGVASLSIDRDYEAVRTDIDAERLIEAATVRLLLG